MNIVVGSVLMMAKVNDTDANVIRAATQIGFMCEYFRGLVKGIGGQCYDFWRF